MQPQFSKAEVATTPEGALVHDDSTAEWFLVSSVAYFFIVGIIAVIIAVRELNSLQKAIMFRPC